MKNLVFQVNIKPNGGRSEGRKKFHYVSDVYEFSNLKASEYAKKYNADYFCLKKEYDYLGKKYTPAYHKLFLYELFDDYDKIFFVDSDAIITKICPNIFEYDVLSATRDNSLTPSGFKKEARKHEVFGLKDDYIYFCSGVVLFDKKFYYQTKDHWRGVLEEACNNPRNIEHDQTVFNILTDRYYGKYNILDDDWGSHRRKGKFINHYSNNKIFTFSTNDYFKWENRL